jgi:iron complex outermembrane receptor protein
MTIIARNHASYRVTTALGLILTSVGASGPAFAQSDASGGTAAEPGIGEIIVTAQKRNQSAQDVGITMSVVSGEALDDMNVTSINEIAALVPNVQANYNANQVVFNVRGVGTNEFSGNLDSPVAVNLDEIYLSKTFMAGLLLYDIDRVEALKGPQGTLFGRNATGGAINFFTRRPAQETGFGLKLGYDNYETLRAEGYVTGALTDTLSARLSGMVVDQDQGFYRNLARGDRDDGRERKYALRGQLLWDSGPTTVLAQVNYGRDRSRLAPYEGLGVFTPASLVAGAPVFCPEYLAGTVRGDTANCVRGTDGLNPGDDDPFTSTNNLRHRVRNEVIGGTLRIEHDLGGATLTSLTAYQKFTRKQAEDSDGSPASTIDILYRNKVQQFSQELRLSPSGKQAYNYVLGLYYGRDSFKNEDYLLVGGGAGPGLYSPFTQKVNAFAAFLHNDVEVSDTLHIIAGVRYSLEKRSLSGGTLIGTGLDNGRPTTILATGSDAALIPGGDGRSDSDVTFKTGVEWKPRRGYGAMDDLLLYGHISTGFRSGSYNAEFASAQSALTVLSPENITAYEAGFKSTLFGRSLLLNGAIFHYSFKDGFINVDSAGSPVPVTINAANISTTGAEVELRWRPARGLNLGMSGGWLDSKINSDISVGGVSLKGNRPVNAPKWTFNADIGYTADVGNGLSIGFGADANYRSSQFLESTNSPASRNDAYWVVNGQIKFGRSDDRWSIAAWVKNLANVSYRTYVNDLPAFGWVLNAYAPPRTFGVTAAFKY